MRQLLLLYIVAGLAGAYFIGPDAASWDAGQTYCKSLGTTLASIHSQEDFDEAATLCAASDAPTECIIGLRKTSGTSAGAWSWTDGTPTEFGFANNDGSQPQTPPWTNSAAGDATNGEHCAFLFKIYNKYSKDKLYNFEDIACSGRTDNYGLSPPICNDLDSDIGSAAYNVEAQPLPYSYTYGKDATQDYIEFTMNRKTILTVLVCLISVLVLVSVVCLCYSRNKRRGQRNAYDSVKIDTDDDIPINQI